MGGAQPLAVTMNGGVALVVEVDPHRIERRLATRTWTSAPPRSTRRWPASSAWRATAWPDRSRSRERRRRAPGTRARGVVPDVVTDQTSAHDALNGYVPNGLTLAEADALRSPIPPSTSRAMAAMADHVRAMLALRRAGAVTFDYGNNIRAQAQAGRGRRLRHPRLRARVHPAALLRGQGAVPLGGAVGRSGRHRRHRRPGARDVRRRRGAVPLDPAGARARGVPGAAGADFLAGLRRPGPFGLALNDLVRRGVVSAPIVIGRDHLDTGSVASPNRETEGMRDGSDAIADWPVLNALLNTASGATWVSVHHGGGVGIGYSLHAGMVVVADGTREADEKLQRVLTCDPGLGVVRHADAGYPEAIETARRMASTCRRSAMREARTDDDP
jgi:urocanate hydratase